MLNISLLIFWWIEYCLLMFMQLCIYVYHHHCIEYEPFWMTIYWCCFVIISLCSPISNVRSINMNFCRHFKKWFQWTSIMIYLTKQDFWYNLQKLNFVINNLPYRPNIDNLDSVYYHLILPYNSANMETFCLIIDIPCVWYKFCFDLSNTIEQISVITKKQQQQLKMRCMNYHLFTFTVVVAVVMLCFTLLKINSYLNSIKADTYWKKAFNHSSFWLDLGFLFR